MTPTSRAGALTHARAPVAVPAASAATSAPASAASTLPAPPPPAPISPELAAELGPEGRERLAIAQSLCAAAVAHAGGKVQVGCRACAPFSTKEGPDGRVVVDPPRDGEFYELKAAHPGSFSRAGATEVAVVAEGCESHAENWGGTLLAERQGERWVAKSYRSGFNPHRCQTFRPDQARDRLLCHWVTMHQGVSHDLLDVYDFVPDDPDHPYDGWKNLLLLEDNSMNVCFDSGNEPVRSILIDDYHLEPGEPLGLVVDIRFAEQRPTKALRAACDGAPKAGDLPHELGKLLHFQRKRLVFGWDGETFAPDAPSRAFIQARRLTVRDSEQ